MKWSRLSVFDLDHTLVKGNSSLNFCLYLVSKNVLPWFSLSYALIYYIRHCCFGLSLERLHTSIFRVLLRGKSLTLLEEHVDDFAACYLEKAVNASTFLRLRLAQHLGDYTVILSNSPGFLVGAFARSLGVDEWRATQYGVDEKKNLSQIDQILQGQDKADYVNKALSRLEIAKKDVTAYSDSYLDLPFLLSAGNPVVVSPDRKLRKYSCLNQWTVI